jgi:hypothetical protein
MSGTGATCLSGRVNVLPLLRETDRFGMDEEEAIG